MNRLFLAVITIICFNLSAQDLEQPSFNAVGLVVSDIKVSETFYTEILGFEFLGEFSLEDQDALIRLGGNDDVKLVYWDMTQFPGYATFRDAEN